jgi:hypothetical protein
MNAEGRPFSQHARAQNISSDGALIAGVDSVLKVGDVIGVQCEDKKSRCTVIWVVNTGTAQKNEIGVKMVGGQECPWVGYLPPDSIKPRFDPSNRRRFYRHKISLPMELREERVNLPNRINATDVSGNGCYIETMQPLPRGTALRVNFWMNSEQFNVTAIVRTCDPGVGNGIEFTGMPADSKVRLQGFLDAVDPQRGISASKSSST